MTKSNTNVNTSAASESSDRVIILVRNAKGQLFQHGPGHSWIDANHPGAIEGGWVPSLEKAEAIVDAYDGDAEVILQVHVNRNDWTGRFIDVEAQWDKDARRFAWDQEDYAFHLHEDKDADPELVEICGPQWVLTSSGWDGVVTTFTQADSAYDHKRGWNESRTAQLKKAIVWICNRV